MADRIARPPFRLNAGFPDGANVALDGRHFLADEPADIYVLVRLGRKKLEHNDDEKADIAVLKVRAIATVDDQTAAAEQLAELLAAQVGQIPFPDGEPAGDAARRTALEADVLHWCETELAAEGESPRALWEHYFGREAPAGPRGAALVHLVEFADEYGIGGGGEDRSTVDAPPADDNVPGSGPHEANARHQAAARPEFAEPEPDWDDTTPPPVA
jgi:hypothetical protein